MVDPSMQEFVDLFLEESGQNLGQLRTSLQSLSQNLSAAEAFDTARRAAHTLKGIASQMGFPDIATPSKEIEEYFVAMRNASKSPTQESVACLLECVTELERMVGCVKAGTETGPFSQPLMTRVTGFKAAV